VVAAFLIVVKQKASTTASNVPLPVPQTGVSSPRTEVRNRPVDDDRLGQELSSAQAQVTSMKDTIQAQRTELESARQATNDLDSRLKDAEQRSALSSAERSQREARIAELEGELEKARSEKNASDTAVTLEEAEVRELQKQLSDDAVALHSATGTRRERQRCARSGGRA
jgi:chromosome segregation ATPase